MTTTYVNAIDEMFALFNAAWQNNTSAIVGYVPTLYWPGIIPEDTPDASKYWGRVSQQTVTEEQSTLSNDEGLPGSKCFTINGLIFVQLFCPVSDVSAMQTGRLLAVVAKKAFRGKTTSSGVVFRNARINELSPENNAIRFNVVAEYEYDEIS